MDESVKKVNRTLKQDDDIVTLVDANGKEVKFVKIDGVVHKGNFYSILQPVELLEGMKDDEALAFKVTRGEGGKDHYELIVDEETAAAVFAEYKKRLDEIEKKKNNN